MTAIEVGGHEIEISNREKVFFPDDGITKGDVVDYYRRISDLMLPHLANRPLVLQRFPDGIDGEGFYQKNASEHFPDWVETATVPRRQGGDVQHVVCREHSATLIYLANQGTLTFHVWPTKIDDLEHPDLLVFDLDPGEKTGLDVVRAAARALRDRLRNVGLTPYLQTSGSRGYHIVSPIDRRADFDVARTFSRALADRVADENPDRFTTAQRKAKRGDRVFLDTNRNAYGQHAVAPYSIRPRPRAPVATPIDWDELGRTEPTTYTVRNIFRRIGQKEDPWATMPEAVGSLDEAKARLDARTG
jgi:bifunctional non-homologous end joining protein LigD